MSFHPEKMAVSTITLARTPEEANLIEAGVAELSSMNIRPIVVADGGSEKQFIERLTDISGVNVITGGDSLESQVIESLLKAKSSGISLVFYTEPDKLEFFKNQAGEFLEKASELATREGDRFGLAVPSRDPESLATFPLVQRYTEGITNDLLAIFSGLDKKDYAYGPRLINAYLIPYLKRLPENTGWGWMSFLHIIALRLGKTLHSIPLYLPCPQKEGAETIQDQLHRLKQMEDHIRGIRLGVMFNLENNVTTL